MPAFDFMIVGLGNPGSRYVRTRHNIGFMALDFLLHQEQTGTRVLGSKRGLAQCWSWAGPDGMQTLLAKPQTYMNLSGRAVKRLCGVYNLQPAQVIVIHDELDLAVGQVRIKFGGGLAGHNGLRSIATELGSPDFYRIRMGIGRPQPGIEITRHVLTPYSSWEEERLEAAIARAVEGMRLLCTKGMQASMNFVHADAD